MLLKEILQEKTFADLHKKNKWIQALKKGDLKEIKENLFVLIDGVYGPLGGHVRIKNPNSVLDPKLTHWEAINLDDDPNADAVIFGSQRFGVKISGFGHDGKGGKKAVIKQLIKVLNRRGFWIEASHRPAEIFMASKRVPFLDQQKDVEKIFGSVTWLGNPGWYIRDLPSGKKTEQEMVFGRPKI